MDKVQFQLESTLPELKDLHEKGLFSRINQITKRRTQFESNLIKRGNNKEDFFRYAEYEIGLETLRRVRWKRLGLDKDPPPPSASSFSIPRRVMYILKRATAKYPADLATWLAYIEYAGRERMRKIVSKGLTSALQHHPLSPTLYLLSSFNHLHPGAPFPRSAVPIETSFALPSSSSSTAQVAEEEDELANSYAIEGTQPARTTLLLGLRMLPKSHDLWREYIKLELQWVEVLRRRWKVLGIEGAVGEIVGGEGAFGEDGEEARKAILGGQLVLQAVKSALEGVPPDEPEALSGEGSGMAFRQGLLDMLRAYPSPLRMKCLEVVYADLQGVRGAQEGQARLLLLTKGLYDRPYDPAVKDKAPGEVVLEGVELVEELGKVGKAIKSATKTARPEFGELAGKWLDERIRESDNEDLAGSGEHRGNAKGEEYDFRWTGRADGVTDERALYSHSLRGKNHSQERGGYPCYWNSLSQVFPGGKGGTTERNEQQGTEAEEESILIIQRAYLLSILGSLAKPALNPSPSLVLLHMSHLSLSPRERSSLLEKHTARNPTNAQLQLLRLRALVETSSSRLSDAAHTIAEEIATAVSRSPSDMTPTDMEAVSFIWSEWFDASPVEKHHSILLLSLRQPCASLVHPALLTRYYTKQSGSSAPVALLNTIKQHYRPAPPFYAFVLDTLSPTDQSMAKVVYEHWTRTCTTQGQKVKAALAYAELLMRARKGREAYDAISRVRAEVAGQVEEGELERGWDRVCREAQEDEEEEGGEDSDVDVAM